MRNQNYLKIWKNILTQHIHYGVENIPESFPVTHSPTTTFAQRT